MSVKTRTFSAALLSMLYLLAWHPPLSGAPVATNAPPGTNAVADIAIYKMASTTNAMPGEIVQFYISAYNNGPSASSNIVVMESLQTGLTATGSNYTYNSYYDPAGGRWYITNLSVGGSASLNLSAQVQGFGPVSNTLAIRVEAPSAAFATGGARSWPGRNSP